MNTEKEIKKILFKHLSPKEYKIFLFGSRAAGDNAPYSDYDIGILGPTKVPFNKLSAIKNDLHESAIPYLVDIVDLYNARPEFKKIVMRNAKPWTL